MRPYRLRRLAAACRLSAPVITPVVFVMLVTLIVTIGHPAAAQAAETIKGTVVDQTGRAVPRAYVRPLDRTAAASGGIFADESGRFELTVASLTDCRIQVTLTGFQPATVPCGAAPLRIVLAIAPIRETVLVSATRTEAPASQVGASATVFTAEDLERRQTPLLADLLRSTPGAMVSSNGGPGSVTSLFVRGGESDYNKVLLDGVPLNEPGGTFYLNNLTTENLDRVEIVRGAYSSLFGSDAMASVIQLFTRRPDRSSTRPRVSAQLDGGTYNTLHVNTTVSGATGRLDYSLGAARFTSDNRGPNSKFENTTLSANIGMALSDSTTLRIVGRGELEHVGTPGATAFGRPDLDAFFERHDGIGSVSLDQQVNRVFRQRASYSLALSKQTSTNLVADPPFTAAYQGRIGVFESSDFLYDRQTDLGRHHASYQADWRLANGAARGDHLLTILADWTGERSTAVSRPGTPREDSRDNFGVAAQHQALWSRLFVTVGGRIERNEAFGTAVVPRGTVVYVAHESSGRSAAIGETRLKASAGFGIKEPTMLESFSQSPFFLGNPDLKPERSRSVEAGIEQRLAGDRAKVEFTYFNNRFTDAISLVSNSVTYEGQYQNIGVTRARGYELGAEAAPASSVRVRGGYTYLDSRILDSAAPENTLFAVGKQAFRRPKHSGFTGVGVNWRRATIDVNGVFIGRFVDSDFGFFDPQIAESPGHTTWDAHVSLALTSRVSGLVSVDNLMNRDYSESLGFQPLQRVIRAGLRVKF